MTIQILTIATVLCLVHHAAGVWVEVEREVLLPHLLEKEPLQIKTNSVLGSEEVAFVLLGGTVEETVMLSGGFQVTFSDPPKVAIRWCHEYTKDFQNPLPADINKTWTFKKAGQEITVTCNDEIVFTLVLSDEACVEIPHWRDYWDTTTDTILFSEHDTSSDFWNASPIDGGWTDFSALGECSKECGGGIQSRSRTCTSPAPRFGGAECEGDAEESENCNPDPCPVDGGFTDFSAWTDCSAECGGGTQSRSRSCSNPAPAHGGAECEGDAEESQDCNTDPCPEPPCEDKDELCPVWVAHRPGVCAKKQYLQLNCKKSCNLPCV